MKEQVTHHFMLQLLTQFDRTFSKDYMNIKMVKRRGSFKEQEGREHAMQYQAGVEAAAVSEEFC